MYKVYNINLKDLIYYYKVSNFKLNVGPLDSKALIMWSIPRSDILVLKIISVLVLFSFGLIISISVLVSVFNNFCFYCNFSFSFEIIFVFISVLVTVSI